MFRALQWRYEYEAQGIVTASGPYLPDFWLPQREVYFEAKPCEPHFSALYRCSALAQESGCDVIVGCGQPGNETPCFVLSAKGTIRAEWLPDVLKEIGALDYNVPNALNRARSARFEFGETPQLEMFDEAA